jgi:hypothetical protein
VDISYIIKVNNNTINDIRKAKCINIDKINDYSNKYSKLYLFIYCEILPKPALYIPKNLILGVCFQETSQDYKFEQLEYDFNYVYNMVLSAVAIKTLIYVSDNNTDYENAMSTIIEDMLNVIDSEYTVNPLILQNVLSNNKNNNLSLNLSVNIKNPNGVEIEQFYVYQIQSTYINTCKFNPLGETLFECKQKCISNKCSEIECQQLCNNCQNLNCKWNIKDFNLNNKLKPDAAMIKGFSGNKLIKITWVKPDSSSNITKYYILVISNISNHFEIYVSDDQRELLDFYITNLENDIPYDIILYSRNEYGISKKSNMETIIPSENSELKEIKKDTFDNTLQNFYELDSETEYLNKVSQFEKEIVYNDLKDVLLKDLNFKIPEGNYNINIF